MLPAPGAEIDPHVEHGIDHGTDHPQQHHGNEQLKEGDPLLAIKSRAEPILFRHLH